MKNYFLMYALDMTKVLRIDDILFNSSGLVQNTRRLAGLFQSVFFKSPNIPSQKFNSRILFLKSLSRADYDKKFKQIYSLSRQKNVVDITYSKKKFIRAYPFYIAFKYFPLLLFRSFNFNLFKTLYLMISQIKYLEVAEKVYKNDFRYLVVFADMQPIDNMICQIAQKKGIKTITLQHGLYVDYENSFNVNIVNYENHTADYFLAWGDDTKELIQKYHKESNIIICGNPLKKINSRVINDYFTVVFDQNLFHKYNKILLNIAYNIAKEFNLKINLKLHPNNKKNWYEIDNSFIIENQDIYSSKFVIGHTTSILYELMVLGIPSYKLRSDIPANVLDEDLKFSTVEELDSKILKHKKEQFRFDDYAKRYIQYIGDKSLNKYKDFFKRMENDEI